MVVKLNLIYHQDTQKQPAEATDPNIHVSAALSRGSIHFYQIMQYHI